MLCFHYSKCFKGYKKFKKSNQFANNRYKFLLLIEYHVQNTNNTIIKPYPKIDCPLADYSDIESKVSVMSVQCALKFKSSNNSFIL